MRQQEKEKEKEKEERKEEKEEGQRRGAAYVINTHMTFWGESRWSDD